MRNKVFLIIAVISVFIAVFTIKANNKPENYEILFNWGTSENINDPKEVEKALLIFDLYKKEDTKEIVQSVINSNEKYKKIFDDIIEFYRSNNGL